MPCFFFLLSFFLQITHFDLVLILRYTQCKIKTIFSYSNYIYLGYFFGVIYLHKLGSLTNTTTQPQIIRVRHLSHTDCDKMKNVGKPVNQHKTSQIFLAVKSKCSGTCIELLFNYYVMSLLFSFSTLPQSFSVLTVSPIAKCQVLAAAKEKLK